MANRDVITDRIDGPDTRFTFTRNGDGWVKLSNPHHTLGQWGPGNPVAWLFATLMEARTAVPAQVVPVEDGTVRLEAGKYNFFKDATGLLRCYRYGEPWREFLGDKAVSALFDRCQELEAQARINHDTVLAQQVVYNQHIDKLEGKQK